MLLRIAPLLIALVTTAAAAGALAGAADHPGTGFIQQQEQREQQDHHESVWEDRRSNMIKWKRLLLPGEDSGAAKTTASSCTSRDITISQGRDSSSSSGIPQYVVQIINTCLNNCTPSDIHVFCGWFASAPLVNPSAFRRLKFNDCIVNDGKPLKHGQIVRFQYANSFMYPIKFKSAKFCSSS